ncbi:hypothetical protein H310_03685 [Aphanomyces invadans]|uniref:Uncharacterized protein n=1 Tax=Aphanomyces invadans TaxID=157072 RepID=A0A024UI23_9STRA|nr:hypothetical protein H310_03685 [Aphanomyces invadans]ETW06091.1 hypothetical protein H310_03685 [Aphanomyces invadans]|eukprot:XP_008865868.1 hypothetical protein H310_03685 [Aphanomyces invadans]
MFAQQAHDRAVHVIRDLFRSNLFKTGAGQGALGRFAEESSERSIEQGQEIDRWQRGNRVDRLCPRMRDDDPFKRMNESLPPPKHAFALVIDGYVADFEVPEWADAVGGVSVIPVHPQSLTKRGTAPPVWRRWLPSSRFRQRWRDIPTVAPCFTVVVTVVGRDECGGFVCTGCSGFKLAFFSLRGRRAWRCERDRFFALVAWRGIVGQDVLQGQTMEMGP